jgi:hypothetical protein
MNLFKRIKKIFTPKEWRIIFTGDVYGKLQNSITGKIISNERVKLIVKCSENHKIRCYVTNGLNINQNVGLDWVVAEYPEVKSILEENGIKI